MLYARVATGTGWTWAEIDDSPLSAVLDLSRYWQRHPLTHELVAGFAGFKADVSAGYREAAPDPEKANWTFEAWEAWADAQEGPELGGIARALGGAIAVAPKMKS